MSSTARKPSLLVMLAPFAVMALFVWFAVWLAGQRGGWDVVTGVILLIVAAAAIAQAWGLYRRFNPAD